jgi:hypothetical protein
VCADHIKDLTFLERLDLSKNPLAKITEHIFSLSKLTVFDKRNTIPVCCRDVAWLKTKSVETTEPHAQTELRSRIDFGKTSPKQNWRRNPARCLQTLVVSSIILHSLYILYGFYP